MGLRARNLSSSSWHVGGVEQGGCFLVPSLCPPWPPPFFLPPLTISPWVEESYQPPFLGPDASFSP